jgi:cyanophycin synthetase
MLLSKTLLQSIRIPIFYTGEIIKIDDSYAEQYTISLLLAHIDHIPRNVNFHALRLSSYLILNFMKRAITDENKELLFEMMKKRFIDPHSLVSGSGKSTMPILREAYRNNIPFRHLKNGIYQLGWGSKARRINRSSTEFDSPIGSMMSHNKIITALLLKEAGLPAAEHKAARSQEEALLAAKELGWPLVVKPSDLDRGEGVSIDVTDNTLLEGAFNAAYTLSKTKQILVERQVEGVCCRIFIANEKMLYAVKRGPKSVKGDGKSSVKKLIDEANRRERSLPPWEKSEVFPLDDLAIETMGLGGFTPESVPEANELVPLRKIESTQWGGVDEDITTVIHPHNIDLSLRAAKLFGLHVAGIDIITTDIGIPWYENGAIINEVNYSPQYGWGEISRRTMTTYLNDLIRGDGRIPITVIVGATEAMSIAKQIQQEQLNNGLRSFISTDELSIDWRGENVYFASKGLYKRCGALLLDSRTDALILVVQTDEFLVTRLPLDTIDRLIIDSEILHSYANPKEILTQKRSRQLITLLKTIT